MKLKIWLFALILMISGISYAQLNAYKYIVVPKRFEAFKQVNQHNTSVLVKYLLSQEGFNVVYDDAQPIELRTDPCLGVYTVLNNNSSLLATKVVIDLVDCQNELVFTTAEGSSKKKDYKEAFAEAIQEAMWSFKGLNYDYRPVQKTEPATLPVPEPDVLEESSNDQAEVVQEEDTGVVKPEQPDLKPRVPDAEIWYAQELPDGFQLVDSTPRIRMKLYNTSLDQVFLAEGDGKTGIVFKEGDGWWYEGYENAKMVRRQLNIRF